MVMGKEMLVMMTWMEMVGDFSLSASLMSFKFAQRVPHIRRFHVTSCNTYSFFMKPVFLILLI